MTGAEVVTVAAPARLHFGMLDLGGSLGRRYGGIGVGIPDPGVVVEAERNEALFAEGPDADRALEAARRCLSHFGAGRGVTLRVRSAIPAHAGLGSGTQLALAVARALAELYGLPADPRSLARSVGRGRRSAIGTWLFGGGGFVVEGGRRPESEAIAPLLARLAIPPAWRCVVAVPASAPGVSGEREAAAFRELPAPPASDAARTAHLVLMAMLPALAEGDLEHFGCALSEVQRINGRWFAPSQGGLFAAGESTRVVEEMTARGVAAVGQSSWGPAIYGIVGDEAAAVALARELRALLAPGGVVYEGPFAHGGARVSRRSASPVAPRSSQTDEADRWRPE